MLRLSNQTYDIPAHQPLDPGLLTEPLDQWYEVLGKRWNAVHPLSVGMPIRLEGPNYRRPVSLRAKARALVKYAPIWFNWVVRKR